MAQINLIVGCTWDFEQLDLIIELNRKYRDKKIRVSELYGSLRNSYIPLPSARPDYRIPDVNVDHFRKFVAKAKDSNIGISYTCNGTFTSKIEEIHKAENAICDAFKILENTGISRLIMSNPLLIEIARSCCSIPIDISTVLDSSFISCLPIYRDWKVDKVHMSIYLNRHIKFLKKYNDSARKYSIRPCLIVNEFCMYGASPCSGVLREACYNCSTTGGNESGDFSRWPFDRCHNARMKSPFSWLSACFILPQHLRWYKERTGISNFKITGRTNSVEHMAFLIKTYLSENYQAKLVNLWVDPGRAPETDFEKQIDVKVSELESVNFFNKWFLYDHTPCDFSCGIICNWCKDKYQEILGRRSTNGN